MELWRYQVAHRVTSKQVELHCHLSGHRRVAEARNLMCSKDIQRIMSAGNSIEENIVR